jgi:hypothetical protein
MSELRKCGWVLTSVLASMTWFAATATAQKLGTDLAGLNLCLYGDCEARGSYVADPFGWANPGTIPGFMFSYIPRGVLISPSYFRLKVGDVGTDIGSGSVTFATDPVVFQANVVYAEASGPVRSMPGITLKSRTRTVRLATAVDLGRTALGLTGFSAGLIFGIPAMSSDLRLAMDGFTVAESHEDHEVELTPGVHWRGGQRDWFGVGAMLNVVRNSETGFTTDPMTGAPIPQRGTTNAWFPRAGISLLPFVPLGYADPSSPAGEWLSEFRVGLDIEHRNISVPTEGTRKKETGYFGADARLLPDAWNPMSQHLRVYLIGGVDTDAGWGIGAGLYGNGILEFLSCNPAFSSRPLAKSLGDRVDIWSATCSAVIPL